MKDGLLVKTIKFDNPRHIGEPIYAIKIFNDYEVDELVIVDIMASRPHATIESSSGGKIPVPLISKISDESCMPVTYGGGVTSIKEIQLLFKAGVEKVCINSAGIRDPSFIRAASSEFGRQSIVASLDVKKTGEDTYEVYTNGGLVPARVSPTECALMLEDAGAGEILLNSIDRDGLMSGYDIPLIRSVSSEVHIPVIALGGAGTKEDLSSALREGGASAAAAGSMFLYFGKKRAVLINYPSRDEIEEIIR